MSSTFSRAKLLTSVLNKHNPSENLLVLNFKSQEDNAVVMEVNSDTNITLEADRMNKNGWLLVPMTDKGIVSLFKYYDYYQV